MDAGAVRAAPHRPSARWRSRRRTTSCWRRNWPPASRAREECELESASGPAEWLTLRQAQALLNAPDIATAQRLRARAVIAVLLGCGATPARVAALTDGRCSGGFTAEATVAARRADTTELSV